MYQEFIVPEQQEILDTFGEWPEITNESVHQFTLHDPTRGDLTISYDPLGQSVRVHWKDLQGLDVINMSREGATHLRITRGSNATGLAVEFKMGEYVGDMRIQIFPTFSVYDQLLFT